MTADPLTRAFVQGLARRREGSASGLEPVLRRLWERARAEGPDFGVEPAAFIHYLAQRVTAEADAPALEALHVSDLLLAFACSRGTPAALRELERRHLARVGEFIAHVSPDRAFIDEVQQRLREKLLLGTTSSPAKIRDYEGRGPLGGWIRMAAIRTATNSKRDEKPAESKLRSVLTSQADPELAAAKRQAAAQVSTAMRLALAALSAEDRSLLKLHHVDGLTVDQLAPMFRAHRSTVARWIARAREHTLKLTLRTLRAELGHDSSAARSLVRFAKSQLDLSLPRLLGAPSKAGEHTGREQG
jgi:RNA polymerase sigma-70 factor (ECF subfamily)